MVMLSKKRYLDFPSGFPAQMRMFLSILPRTLHAQPIFYYVLSHQ
jgi:hypothetical protein